MMRVCFIAVFLGMKWWKSDFESVPDGRGANIENEVNYRLRNMLRYNFYFTFSFIRTMFFRKRFLFFAFVTALSFSLLLNSSCRKEQFGNGNLTFSTDTLTFDTVFTTLGSVTRSFKVFNTANKAVKISDIRLKHLVGTQFHINVDGMSGDHFTDVEIPAKDSIYVSVEVIVDPNNITTPLVIIDDVSFVANGNESIVHLQAFGQNAHFHYGEEITSNDIWNNDLPHVIISKDTVPGVYVRCGATLTIKPGCKIFFAGNSAIFVEGTLSALASSWSDSIVFQGARLEEFYQDKPGQWFGIVFLRDKNNTSACAPFGYFSHCVVNESSYGIYAGAGLSNDLNKYLGVQGRPEIQIDNTIVKNSQDNAVYGFNAKITANNSIFHTAGEHLIKIGLGGEYNFTHCTMVNNGSRYISHEKEALLLSNFVSDGVTAFAQKLETTFSNCVLYGTLENEISFNNYKDPPTDLSDFDNTFRYSDVKAKEDTFNMFTAVHDNILFNQEPKFKKADEGNFTPWDSVGYFSPLIDKCSTILSTDIFGNPRVDKLNNGNGKISDMGAIETQ